MMTCELLDVILFYGNFLLRFPRSSYGYNNNIDDDETQTSLSVTASDSKNEKMPKEQLLYDLAYGGRNACRLPKIK